MITFEIQWFYIKITAQLLSALLMQLFIKFYFNRIKFHMITVGFPTKGRDVLNHASLLCHMNSLFLSLTRPQSLLPIPNRLTQWNWKPLLIRCNKPAKNVLFFVTTYATISKQFIPIACVFSGKHFWYVSHINGSEWRHGSKPKYFCIPNLTFTITLTLTNSWS